MFKIRDEGIILKSTNLAFENKAVFNPACIEVDGITHMFYRAVNRQDISSIGYCQLKNNQVVKRLTQPILAPEFDYEKKGVEDPRITLLNGTYYLFYTAFDGKNALVAYATSKNLINFSKHGLISPRISYDKAEDIFRHSQVRERYTLFEVLYKARRGQNVLLYEKDVSLFPQKFKGKYALIHRILPGIQLIYFKNFTDLTDSFWRKYLTNLGENVIIDPLYWYESRNVGGGGPPIKTKAGWLIIYHAVEDTPLGKIYHAGAALLDLNNPLKVIGRLKEPLFSPKASWEKKGFVNNVVFPTGAIVKSGRLFIYYGAADTCIGAKSVNLDSLLTAIKQS
ncbi:MAG: pesticidal protein Cry7Aa [Microgenomates group bacterium GW2011_GWC1_49_7]|nr:MAG: pesticidal protein Cry7Aa [Microgenomates group bacterium GW2011_GWC1_49_7]